MTTNIEDQLALLKSQLAEAQQQQREEQRRREEEQQRREEEQQRREALEAITNPTDLPDFLWRCHALSLAIDVVTDPTQTTKGGTAKPTRRFYPSRILPWDGFADKQKDIWDIMQRHPSFVSKEQFPSRHQLDYVRNTIRPITAELDLRHFEQDTVETPVEQIVNKVYGDEVLRQEFSLKGSVTFQSHTNLGTSAQSQSLSEGMQQLSVESRSHKNTGDIVSRGQADRFCVYRRGFNENVPVIAIEYKAPHKLTCDELATALTGEIRPAEDIIDREEDTPEFYARRLTTVVITQLFSYMVRKGVRFGFVCTGQAFVFLNIPDTPSIVKYAMCVPNLDVQVEHEDDFHLTTVAQVVAFTLRALATLPPSQEWHDAAAKLDAWPVEYADVLAQTPADKRLKPGKDISSVYGGKLPRNLPTFHMSLRCRPAEERNSDRSPSPPSPDSPSPSNPSGTRGRRTRGVAGQASQGKRRAGSNRDSGTRTKANKLMPIGERPFCSQKCLRGLRDRHPLDRSCPNFQDHQGKPVPSKFLARVRSQLANDRGEDADCRPLYRAGSYGALFKIRLSSHGFTFVAKGATLGNHLTLQHEMKIYDRLHDIQGLHVPICLGIVKLKPEYPYYYDGGKYTHMLLLSWAGKSITEILPTHSIKATQMPTMLDLCLRAIHQRGVLHKDAEPRNVLWNDSLQHLMLVDFGRASIRSPLTSISSNTMRKKNLYGKDEFAVEIQKARCSLLHALR